jgi:two-component system response regulator (stage 0 sporulation protein F)
MLARELARSLGALRFPLHGVPDRQDIARALLRGESVIVDGDLATVAEREAILSIGEGARQLQTEWRCGRAEAEREIFHRFAGRPRCLSQSELERYLADAEVREPGNPGDSCVCVNAGLSLAAQVAAVTSNLPPPPESALTRKPQRRVLIVEDDVEERVVLAEVLRELDVAVELAPDAGVALALLEGGGEFDLVITDHRMPGMTGVELARHLWTHHPEVRAVLLTAYGDQDMCVAAEEAHAVTVLSKPVHILDLTRVLDEARA